MCSKFRQSKGVNKKSKAWHQHRHEISFEQIFDKNQEPNSRRIFEQMFHGVPTKNRVENLCKQIDHRIQRLEIYRGSRGIIKQR